MVSDAMNQALMMPIMDDEIKDATRQMGALKAPGPDGFSGVFYHSFWDNISNEVHELVHFLMIGDVYPQQLNATHIVLILKVRTHRQFLNLGILVSVIFLTKSCLKF